MLTPFAALAALAALASLASASPLAKRSAAEYAGTLTTDVYPPTQVPTGLAKYFPNESEVGFPQTTLNGAFANALETAIAAPSHTNIYPLIVPAPAQTQAGAPKDAKVQQAGEFRPERHWGNIGPQYSVSSEVYGLDGASPRVPDDCSVTQVHIYYRHGARFPSDGAITETFAAKVNAAANNETTGGFEASGALAFLNTWNYKLGKELLAPFGRQQNFDLGVGARLAYGHLLQNFTEQGALPVFRTQSQDRMVKTAQHFAAGFFGLPSEGQYNLEITVEADGYNNTGAPYSVCPAADLAYGSVGSTAAAKYYATALAPTIARLNKLVTGGLEFALSDVESMLQMCAWETTNLGYSKFCEVFSEEEFKIFEYGYDLQFYGNNFLGSPVAAAQGLGYLQEFYARLTQTPIPVYDSETNKTLDSNPITFPLNQSIYADAAHEVSILDFFAALNLTALAPAAPSATHPESDGHVFVTSRVVPMGTQFVSQVMECSTSQPTKQIRFIVNDAVVPQTYEGCDPKEFNGLCAFDTVVEAIGRRIDEIDFEHDCFGNYTLPVGISDLNGRAPRN